MAPTRAMVSFRIRALVAAGLATGLGFGFIFYLLEVYFGKDKRKRILNDIYLLQESVSDLRTELSTLRSSLNNGDGNEPRVRRLRRRVARSNHSIDEISTNDVYSIADTEDDEFFDISSDDDDVDRLEPSLKVNVQNEDTDEVEILFKEVDHLMKGPKEDQCAALNLLLSRKEQYDDNVRYLWRVAKAYRLQASAADGDGDKLAMKTFVDAGLNYGKRAVEVGGESGDAHKWYAILLGMRNEFLSTKERLPNGIMFQKHLELALVDKPDDYSLYYLLARFKFEIANLSWVEKKLAKTFLGEVPDLSADDAFNDAKRAEELCPEPWADNRVLLAKCCIANSNFEGALDWLEKAKEALNDSPQCLVAKKEIEVLFSKYSKYKS